MVANPNRGEQNSQRIASQSDMSNREYDHIAHIYLQVESFIDRSWSWPIRVLPRISFVGEAGLVSKTLEIEKAKVQIDRLWRMQFGHSSENLRARPAACAPSRRARAVRAGVGAFRQSRRDQKHSKVASASTLFNSSIKELAHIDSRKTAVRSLCSCRIRRIVSI